jgi:hypothetical protein
MPSSRSDLSRRQFLAGAVATAGVMACPDLLRAAEPAAEAGFSFFVISDTHYLADVNDTAKPDPDAAEVIQRFVDVLTRLPGTKLSGAMGGGAVGEPRGVIHCGDVVDSADKNGAKYEQMQKTEFSLFERDFGLKGGDGKLKWPVYEMHGNHDGPQGNTRVIEKMKERNRSRVGVTNVSKNGLHYSWDWGKVHFVSLGITVGAMKSVTRKRRYNPCDSYDFLVEDLAAKVGKSGRPVVLLHHVDVARYTGPCDPNSTDDLKMEWDRCDVHGFHEAIKGYNIVADFYGHTHYRTVFKWDGQSPKAPAGIDVFNIDDASHHAGPKHGFFHVTVTDREMIVREHRTTDHWKTAEWSEQWVLPLMKA